MAGFLFVICIPREKYEKCILNVRQSSEDENEVKDAVCEESFSSISIQGSSVDSNKCEVFPFQKFENQEPTTSKITNEKDIRFKRVNEFQGSMDSEIFTRNLEREKQARENEEAVEKFFSTCVVNNLSKNKSMECVLREIVDRMQIRNVSWQKVNNKNSFKVMFSLEKGVRCDDTIHLLSEYGIGQKKGSSCVIIPCSVYKDKSHLKRTDADTSEGLFKETSWNRHIGNVRARLNVEKLVHAVKSDATLSFDFIILLITASMVASFGLIENSTLILTASMLISPLMGPILAATFGAIIKDSRLHAWGLRNEIVGTFLCIVVGFFFGIVVCFLDYIFGTSISITQEMLSRCTWHSVVVGIFIALLSGAAQSIALLRENFGSLVGVAISASLLPPAVNTGLMWSYSVATLSFQYLNIEGSESLLITQPTYSEDGAIEFVFLGSISLFLTITNVICVYLMGYIFLRIKIEVAPISTEEERQFWKHDVPIARDYNKTLNGEDGRKLKEEVDAFRESESNNFKGVAAELLRQDFYSHTHTWSPLMYKFNRKEPPRTSVIDFTAFCNSMMVKQPGDLETKNLNKSLHVRHSDPIATPKVLSSTDPNNPDSSSEPIRRQTTFVDIESNSNDEEDRIRRKFVITPAKDDSSI